MPVPIERSQETQSLLSDADHRGAEGAPAVLTPRELDAWAPSFPSPSLLPQGDKRGVRCLEKGETGYYADL